MLAILRLENMKMIHKALLTFVLNPHNALRVIYFLETLVYVLYDLPARG